MASLQEAVVKGLAADRGLFMPMTIKPLPQDFYDTIDTLSFQEIAYRVADAFFGEDIPADTLKQIVYDTLSFDVPLVKVADNIYSLELFHGPTLAFKDVGGRFMVRLLGYFIKKEGQKDVNVLVATSGDTGSAVANGFLGVEGIHVYVLYPKGKVSEIQEKQFTTLGQNITALEVDGTFDDCQALVKAAFMDKELNEHLSLTSANSINVARFLPQAFYYFYAYAQLKRAGKADNAVICVPSGNIGMVKIVSESSVAAGVRRIEAYTGARVEEMLDTIQDTLSDLKALFNNTPDLGIAIRKYLEENAGLKKQVEDFMKEKEAALKERLLKNIQEIHGIKVIKFCAPLPAEVVKNIAFQLRGEITENLFFVAGSTDAGKPMLTVMISDNLVAGGLKAGNLVKEAAKLIQGGGGGQPHFATAGGKNADGLPAAVEKVLELAGI